jgi:hypothetical protein
MRRKDIMNDRKIRIWKVVVMDYTKVLFWYFPEEIEENLEKPVCLAEV